MLSTTLLLFVLLAASFAHATEYGRTLADPGNGEIVPLDIALDNDSMIVYPGTPYPPQDCFKQSINLHDFNKSLVAIKIVDLRVCYIKPSFETYQEVAERLHHKGPQDPTKQASEEWDIGKKVIKQVDVEPRFGSLIANFCSGYDVFTMENGHLVNSVVRGAKRARRPKRARRGWCFLCFTCTIN